MPDKLKIFLCKLLVKVIIPAASSIMDSLVKKSMKK
jgi:hypothetical protein